MSSEKPSVRLLIRRIRQGTLFLTLFVVAIWGWINYQADNKTFAWDRSVRVSFVALMDENVESGAGPHSWMIQRFLSRASAPGRNLRGVEAWLQDEYTRLTGERAPILDFMVSGPAKLPSPPPETPTPDDGFFARLQKTREFLGYFEDLAERNDVALQGYDAKIFIYFFDPEQKRAKDLFLNREAVASRRGGVGVVFAPLSKGLLGNTCALVAHELLHIFGASDKYDGNRSVYPQGFAEPNRSPLYPQPKAEIMALGRPLSDSKEEAVTTLNDCSIGSVTAREIGWSGLTVADPGNTTSP